VSPDDFHGINRREFETVEVHTTVYARRQGFRLEATARRGPCVVIEAATWDDVLDMLPGWARETEAAE